jgi:predicted nuclease with TOPRIM domain
MTDTPQERADALRREAAWLLEQARTATTQKRRDELTTLATRFDDLAAGVPAHSFGEIMQSIERDLTGQPVTQQQQQIQPKEG